MCCGQNYGESLSFKNVSQPKPRILLAILPLASNTYISFLQHLGSSFLGAQNNEISVFEVGGKTRVSEGNHSSVIPDTWPSSPLEVMAPPAGPLGSASEVLGLVWDCGAGLWGLPGLPRVPTLLQVA